MDRFEDLRAFVQVIESGSLTRAADRLDVATSAVSRRIKELESRLGTQLLQRTTRQMRLTPSGERFHAKAREILQALEEAEAEAGDQSRALEGPLRLAIPLSFGQTHLSPIMLDFCREHPGVQLDVDLSDRQVDLVAEGHDLAIRIGNLANSSLIARRLAVVRLVVAASPAFWDSHGRPETPDDLKGVPALCYTGSERVDRWSYTAPDGQTGTITVPATMRATNGHFLCDAAAAGLGVVMQPSFIVQDAVHRGVLEPVLTTYRWPTITVHAVYPETRHLSARARAFIDFVRARIKPLPEWEGWLDASKIE
ncbi:MAG: LysR family transcriptional regulator [Pseudomonadota bacterium]